jgi:ABC-type glutathione transport system ATPase component
MKHRGEIVEKAIRESGIPLAEIARRLKKSRRHLYNIFQNPHLSLDEILQIGKIIHYDFSREFTEVRKDDLNINNQNIENKDYWKNKYLSLLEKYNELLEKITSSN